MGTATIPAIVLDPASGPPVDPVTIDAPARTVIGRTRECDVVLDDAGVSRQHALIEWRDAGWYVTDPGSHNGVYVNSIRIDAREPAVLRDQDLLRIAHWTFVVRLSPGPEHDPAPEPPALAERPPPVAEPAPPPRHGTDRYVTHASIFVRLGAPDSALCELSWRQFHDFYGPVIRGFARNAGLPAQDADDILQEVMLGFFSASARFEYDPAKGRFRGYLKRATLNAIRARHRRRAEAHLEDESACPDPETSATAWDHEWSKSVLRRALNEVAARVESVTFEAFELYGRRGVPAAAAAERLGLTEDGVRQAKCRVMRAVREVLDRIREAER